MGKVMSKRRKEIVEEVKRKDAQRRGKRYTKAVKGNPRFQDERRAEAERRRNRKPRCCIEKGNLPMYFRPCPDCTYEVTDGTE